MTKDLYGYLPDGTPVYQFLLENEQIRLRLINYGCTLTQLQVPDRNGNWTDILLGYPSIDSYLKQSSYMGALIGRYANRIADSAFSLNGKTYLLPPNDGSNHLHGGPAGFDKRVFQIKSYSKTSISFIRTSPDGEAGYPGNMQFEATYSLNSNTISVVFSAISDQDTIRSFTLHPYFNLSGDIKHQLILDHYLQINSDYYTPVRLGCIPTGEICPVRETPFDFRSPYKIGQRIDQPCSQLQFVGGYDHNFVLNGKTGELKNAAKVWSDDSGIEMEIQTTMPGLQFYSGNFIDSITAGNNGVPYKIRSGFCLEPQQFPDAPNQSAFPSPILKAGIQSTDQIQYSFGIHTGEDA